MHGARRAAAQGSRPLRDAVAPPCFTTFSMNVKALFEGQQNAHGHETTLLSTFKTYAMLRLISQTDGTR